jgi:hypothetical protein
MKKLLLLLSAVLLLGAGCTSNQATELPAANNATVAPATTASTTPTVTLFPKVRYGSINFPSNEKLLLSYPLFFNQIKTQLASKQNSALINFGPTNFPNSNFSFTMSANILSLSAYKTAKANLVVHGLTVVGAKTTANGHAGELLVKDYKAYPESTEDCTLTYWYFIPLTDNKNVLSIMTNLNQPAWKVDQASPCLIFQENNYNYFKAIFDHIVANVQA